MAKKRLAKTAKNGKLAYRIAGRTVGSQCHPNKNGKKGIEKMEKQTISFRKEEEEVAAPIKLN